VRSAFGVESRDQFLVTDAFPGAVELEEVVFESIGSRSLKGVSKPVELFEVRTSA